MKTVRRLYFYAVALISLEVVLWGGIGLLRSIVDRLSIGGAEALAQALALILVGVPIFLFHWLWVQRTAARDDEEKTAALRAVFFYAALIGTLVPVAQNLLAMINRLLLGTARLSVRSAILGGTQTWPDNLIAVIVNLIVATYFWNLLRGEWKTLPETETFVEIRRLYRYLWTLYGLLMSVFGAQQILRFIFFSPTNVLGITGRETFVNGLALILVGTPVWIYTWRICQDALADPAERESNLRLGVLYLLALGGVISVLTAGGNLIYILLNHLLGATTPWDEFVQQISGPISIGIPLATVWAYYGFWLNRHIEAVAEGPQRDALKRPYLYILSLIGLVTAFVGVSLLVNLILDMTLGSGIVGDSFLRGRQASAIATLVVGLPLWLLNWLSIEKQTIMEGGPSTGSGQASGDHARRSLVRKTYLYLVLFASVIGGMITAVILVFKLLSAALTGNPGSDFLVSSLNLLQLLVWFAVVLVYHLLALRRDGISTANVLAAKQAEFSVLVLNSGDGKFGEAMKAALFKQSPQIPVTVMNADGAFPDGMKVNALVLPGSVAVNPPAALGAWLHQFNGSRLIVPDEALDIVWSQDAGQAALSVRQMAEGQKIRKQKKSGSAWMIVVYIFAALFALQVLFMLFALAISTIIN
jgi:hypothetical protein